MSLERVWLVALTVTIPLFVTRTDPTWWNVIAFLAYFVALGCMASAFWKGGKSW